jgi:hypothetical protein
MSIQTYDTPNQIIVEGMSPSINYNPNLNLKKRAIVYLTAIEDNSYTMNINVEHYFMSDVNRKTIVTDSIKPYIKIASVNQSGTAYVNLVTNEIRAIRTEEQLQEITDDVNPWMREIESFNYLFNENQVNLKMLIQSVIQRYNDNGLLD